MCSNSLAQDSKAPNPEYALRLGLVTVESDLLLVLCLAAEDELNAAWDEVQPIMSSVVF